MTQQKIISFDPGYVTGIATGVFDDEEALTITGYAAVTYENMLAGWSNLLEAEYQHVVSEVFKARTDNEFVPDLTGVRVEGLIDLAYTPFVRWRERTKKNQVPDQLLKDHGLWLTGPQVNWEDGRDVNDAIIHMLGYVAFDLRHKPTLQKYFR